MHNSSADLELDPIDEFHLTDEHKSNQRQHNKTVYIYMHKLNIICTVQQNIYIKNYIILNRNIESEYLPCGREITLVALTTSTFSPVSLVDIGKFV